MRISKEPDDEDSKIFHDYITQRKILIADSSSASRVGLAQTLINLGASLKNLILVNTFDLALSEMERAKPHVVITDYQLGNRCGLDLLQHQRQFRPESKECLFILVTGNTSQSAIAQAAEEDVDTFILKPYTIEVFRKSVMRAAAAKIRPSEYTLQIEVGKGQLFSGDPDSAMTTFSNAMKLKPKPALAYFYHGQALLMKEALDSAQTSYSEGLGFNKIHYKCMVGLYEVLVKRKMHDEAYGVVQRLSRYFPTNPKRLASVLRLAIMTKHYEDIERYYQAFKDLDNRDEELTRYICAALTVCGKYYLQTQLGSRALELFRKAAITAVGRPKVLREIITGLCEFGLHLEAKAFLSYFPPVLQGQVDYLSMEMLVLDRFLPPGKTIENGRQLILRGMEDPVIYAILIRRSTESGLADYAEFLTEKVKKLWPVKQ